MLINHNNHDKEVLSSLTWEEQNSLVFPQLCGTPASVTSAANGLSTGNVQEAPGMQIRVPMFLTGCKPQMALNMAKWGISSPPPRAWLGGDPG